MTDVWSFLLQTLTASGAALLLLAVKVLLRDKLSPRWQFAVWSVLALVLLLPAGLGGRYALLNWPLLVETAKSYFTGEFGSLARVLVPIPLPPLAAPGTVWDWLYLIYAAGVIALLARYMVSYIRLRLALKKGRPVRSRQVRAVAEAYGLRSCPVVEVNGLPTAFICGVFQPVLALPAGVETDDKVILHELLHLKHKDVVWGWVIAFFRCVHWCNPILWLCADWAGNDLESLCDQRVLERLEGEDRRGYGRILLSMADEKYARTPGTSSASNGGENVRRRIEAIARFKRYPSGMALASVCVALVLAVPLVLGVQAETVPEGRGNSIYPIAAARTVRCTTPAGAFDVYAKAVLTGKIPYLAMCAPLDQQNELAAAYGHGSGMDWMMERSGLPGWPNAGGGYRVYNLTRLEDGSCEGLLAVILNDPPDGTPPEDKVSWLAVQRVRAEREGDRWVAIPQEDFQAIPSRYPDLPTWLNDDLPSMEYEAQGADFIVRAQWWTSATLWEDGALTPEPHGVFDYAYYTNRYSAVYIGDSSRKADYKKIAVSAKPFSEDKPRPQLQNPLTPTESSGSSSSGAAWGSHFLDGDWDSEIWLGGGGSTFDWERDGDQIPERIAAELYLNGTLAAELTLLPVEGGAWTYD